MKPSDERYIRNHLAVSRVKGQISFDTAKMLKCLLDSQVDLTLRIQALEVQIMDLINSPQAPDEVKVVQYEEQTISALPFSRASIAWFAEQGVYTIVQLEAWMKANGGDTSIEKAQGVGAKTARRVSMALTHLRESYRVLEGLRSGNHET